MRARQRRRLGGGLVGDEALTVRPTISDSRTAAFGEKVPADDPRFKAMVAEPVMQAVDSMPAEFRALVHDFGYVDVYRAWRRGLTAPQIRAAAEANGGRFEL